MGRMEFVKKAKELGMSDQVVQEIVDELEAEIADGLPVDWSMYLISPAVEENEGMIVVYGECIKQGDHLENLLGAPLA